MKTVQLSPIEFRRKFANWSDLVSGEALAAGCLQHRLGGSLALPKFLMQSRRDAGSRRRWGIKKGVLWTIDFWQFNSLFFFSAALREVVIRNCCSLALAVCKAGSAGASPSRCALLYLPCPSESAIFSWDRLGRRCGMKLLANLLCCKDCDGRIGARRNVRIWDF